jgi:hypothetical protein
MVDLMDRGLGALPKAEQRSRTGTTAMTSSSLQKTSTAYVTARPRTRGRMM